MVSPNKALLDRVRPVQTITIDGEEWPVPALTPKQNEIVVPILLDLWPKLDEVQQSKDKLAALNNMLGGENLKRLYDCIFTALQRGHPELTREVFDSEFGIGVLDAFDCIMPIATASGMLRMVEKAGAAPLAPPAPDSPTG